MDTFTTRTEAIDQIITAIEAGDATAAEFDIDAIADEVITTTGEGTELRYHLTDDEDAFWASVERHQRALRLRWTTDGAVDPDATFTVHLEAEAEDGEWDSIDSEELRFHGDVQAFESDTDWTDTEDALLARNGLDRDSITDTITIG